MGIILFCNGTKNQRMKKLFSFEIFFPNEALANHVRSTKVVCSAEKMNSVINVNLRQNDEKRTFL